MAQVKQIQKVRSAVLSGTGRDVIRQLNRSLERRTVAVTFADDEQGAAAERVIHQVVEFLPQLIQNRQEETLRKVVNLLLTDVTPSRAAREQARMLIEAKTTILNSGDFLPATEVAKLAAPAFQTSIDLGPKLTTYAAAGIRQFIVVDLVNDRVLVHERPGGNSYSSVTVLQRGETLQISAETDVVPLPVDRLLP